MAQEGHLALLKEYRNYNEALAASLPPAITSSFGLHLLPKLPPRVAPSASPGPAPKRARLSSAEPDARSRAPAPAGSSTSAAGPSAASTSRAALLPPLLRDAGDSETSALSSEEEGGNSGVGAGPSSLRIRGQAGSMSNGTGRAVTSTRLSTSNGVQSPASRRREGLLMMAEAMDGGDEDEDSGPEPDTEHSDDEQGPPTPRAALGSAAGRQAGAAPPRFDLVHRSPARSNGAPNSSASPHQLGRAPLLRPPNGAAARLNSQPSVVDLTDSNDDDDDDPPPPPVISATASFSAMPGLTNGSSAASSASSFTFTKDPKGKGKARAISTPPPPPPPAEPPAPSLATLSCPICLGPPTPLALTSCGHAFCAPCLHAALVAGPALTPPPPDLGPGTRGARGRGVGGGPAAQALFVPRGRGRGRARGRGAVVETGAEEQPGELDKHCPVCRHPLRGGWGKSLRGLIIRMAPAKKKEDDDATADAVE